MKNNKLAFFIVTTLFFMWGFITCMNDILIPFVKAVFDLTRAQSMFVQMAFFGAYFLGSLIYFGISASSGDPIQKIGYKKGIIIGLLLSATGCLMLYPAAGAKVYGLFLAALFVLGLGFTLLQIAANPYVAILGSQKTASSRLNLAQGFNSFGTTIAPILGGYLVFHFFARRGAPLLDKLGNAITMSDGNAISAMGVQLPYMIFAGIFLILALVFALTKLPRFTDQTDIKSGLGALKHRHLFFGMFAIFFYVGGEVSIGSVMINYLHELMGYPEMIAKSFLALYWGGLMIGRFLGAYTLGQKHIGISQILIMLLIALGGFGIIYGAIYLESGLSIRLFLPYLMFVIANIIVFTMGKSNPARTLTLFAASVIILLSASMLTSGVIAMWAILSIGLFNSIMWSNIFTLAIRDLESYTSQGSSLLVMMILGGAVLPPLMGWVADILGGYHYALFIPIIAYIYLAWYGISGSKTGIIKLFSK
jgi:FHS family L-fucose permease-like MFS transporter